MTTPFTPTHRRIATVVAALMVSNAIVAGTVAQEAEAFAGARDDLRMDEPVEVTPVEAGGGGFVDQSADLVWDPAVVATGLPAPGAAVFQLGAGSPAMAGNGFPVSVTGPGYRPGVPAVATSGTVRVEILGAQAAQAAGVSGMLVEVTAAGSGTADLTVDYSGFADLFGGGWGARLGLFELPSCAVATPVVDGCPEVTPVPSANDVSRGTVSASFRLDNEPESADASGRRLFAVMASAGGSGDYRATDLSPAGSWASGGNDGAFTYSYPLRLPPAAGPVPSVSLGYSSASHDGRTSGSNSQASWLGDGWGFEPGFVERSYKPCSLDEEGSSNPDVTGDLCWDGDGASVTMSLNGSSTTLVRDDASGAWRAQRDSNWRIELVGSAASGGTATSEQWKITTTDGTQYFFGSEPIASSSRWTVPVFGNHAGEPCRSATFAGSSCRQAYRWMVDKVVDVHGNLVRYFYATETGNYGAAGDPDNRVAYHRAGRLTRIDYGLRAGDSAVAATGRVLFDPADRCLSDCGTVSDPNEESWPDTPWDLHCAAAPCTSQLSPSFFSTKRLATVTAQVRNSGTTTFRNVDSWALSHEFKDYGDAEQVTLWLKSIRHTGHVGTAVSLPAVQFGGEMLPNRVDAVAGVPVMWRTRLSSVKTETGAVITVDYAPPQCTPGSLPAEAHTNTMRCYPVRWTPEFFTEPVEDWFHKHVVASVVETDTTGGSVATETYYDYSTTGGGTAVLWAWDDSEFTEDEHRTYGQWRGFAQVTTRAGDPTQTQTRSRSRFYRGLDEQPLPSGGTRSVSLTDAEGNTVADHETLAGQVWESLAFNGASVISGSTYRYWTRRTATRAREHDGGDLDAWLSGVTVDRARTLLVGSTWQRSETRTSFDTQGRVSSVSNLGDVVRSGDETCARTEYTDNNNAWIKDAVSRLETVGVDCATTASRPADVVSDTRMFFDGSNSHGAVPTKGLLTRTDVPDSWGSGPVYATTARMVYDSLGRVVQTSDALGRTSTTAYTPAGAGPVTKTVATNPAGHAVTTDLEPAWGVPTATVEPNGRRTDLVYDGLGRSTAVWLPGRAAAQSASMTFEYLVRDTAPSAVITRTLNHAQAYVVSVGLFDSLLRQRQTQTETADRGRLVTETVYDTQGRVDEEFGPNHNTGPPGTTIVRVREEDSAARTGFFYDAAGRVTDEVFYNKHVERWRTITSYGGSSAGFMVAVQPPEGAPATATLTNARGETVEKRTYHGNTPTGAHYALTYRYTAAGQLEAMTDPAGNDWSWEYDLRGQQVAAEDPDAGTTTMAYDHAGQLTSTTDARGETIVNGYDELGRQISRRDGDGTLLAEWQFDTAINGVGMLAKATRWVDGNPYTNDIRSYNNQGLVSQTSVVLPASEDELAGRYWFTQSYYPNGQVVFQGFDDAGEAEGGILHWTYDHVGNPTSLVFDGDHTGIHVIVDEATFTPFNEVQTRRFGASNERHAFQGFVYEEGTRRLERATFDREASLNAVADLRYTYDGAGNMLSIGDVPEDLPANHELQCFQYDHQRRLVEAWAQGDTSGCASSPGMSVLGGPAPYWHSYDHDVTGNRTSETLRAPGQPARSNAYTYPAAGQPQPHTLRQVTAAGTGEQASFGYDQAGNTTSRDADGQEQTLQWDVEGNLETVDEPGEDTVRMVYDADGNRLIRDDGDTVTAFMPQTELTWNRTNGEVEGTRYFSHAGQVVATCTGQDVADWTWMGVDHHGTTTTHTVNAFTAVEQVRRMDPYGNSRGAQPATWPGQQGFVGGVDDPTGLVHIGARSYDPATGRFISVDPILALDDNQQINGYAYANNNPISFTDPTGMFTEVNGVPCIDGDCSYHNPDGSIKNQGQCGATGGCGRGPGSSTAARTTNEDKARDQFFGPPPDDHVRAVFDTDAIAPGNGVIIARFFISDEVFYGIGVGDGRGFSLDVEAGYRVVIAWDTETGRVSITAAPSCTVIKCFAPLGVGDGNDIEILGASGGTLAAEFSADSAVRGLPAINQTVRLNISESGSIGSRIDGDPYPDFEAVVYRGDDAAFMGASPHATPGGPGIQLMPVVPRRDLAWIDGHIRWQDGQPHAADRLHQSSRDLCFVNPIALGC